MADLCPGTLVVHSLPNPECTDPQCVDCASLNHALVIPCDEVDGPCPLCDASRTLTAA